jgi:hypothetical protein
MRSPCTCPPRPATVAASRAGSTVRSRDRHTHDLRSPHLASNRRDARDDHRRIARRLAHQLGIPTGRTRSRLGTGDAPALPAVTVPIPQRGRDLMDRAATQHRDWLPAIHAHHDLTADTA